MSADKSVAAVRLGIIGSGLAVKRLHWPALEQLKEQFVIAQVADINPAAAQEVAAMAGDCPWSTDYHDVLTNAEIDAVLISVPIHLNAQFTLEAARAGKHVLCEKPIAANWEQGVAVVKALENTPVVVLIAENYHYKADLVKAREWIDAGRIGEVFLIQCTQFNWTDVTKGFASTPWRQDNQYRGGVLADACVHQLAGLRDLGGEVEQLQAFVKSIHPVMGGYDTMILNARYRSGALGQFSYSAAARPGRPSGETWQICGTEGMISIEQGKVSLTRAATDESGKQTETDSFNAPKGLSGYYEEFLNFYNAIRNAEPVKSTPAEALKDWELVMRALDLAESREVLLL